MSEAGDGSVEFVRASDLADPNTEADFWFGQYTPTALGRELLWVAETFDYEQDERGLVFTNGLLAWPQPPVSYGDPRTREERKLHLFHECAMVFSTSDARGTRVRIRTMGRLIQLAREPRTVEGSAPPDWLIKAYNATSPFGPDLAVTLTRERTT